jgi:uncharacterized protein (UPF0303 family)
MALPTNIDVKAELAAVREWSASFAVDSFTEHDAWLVGTTMRERALAGGLAIVIDIRRGEYPLFSVMLPGATLANFDWARRKRTFSLLTEKTSWEHSLMRENGDDLIAMMGLDPRDHVSAGGCVPVRVHGAGVVATVTVSGLPQWEDHRFVVAVLEDFASGRLEATTAG